MKKQIYKLSLISFLGLGAMVSAQVGINEDVPKATLQIAVAQTNESANTNEGILIPQLSKERVANIADGSLVEGTMIYVDGISYSGSNNKVSRINANGFYYYDGKLWVKVGDKASFTARLEQTTGAGYDWTNGEEGLADFYEFTTDAGAIILPDPTKYPGAIIHYKNSTGGAINYTGGSGIAFPDKTNSITASSAQVVWSNGTKWYLIGGRN